MIWSFAILNRFFLFWNIWPCWHPLPKQSRFVHIKYLHRFTSRACIYTCWLRHELMQCIILVHFLNHSNHPALALNALFVSVMLVSSCKSLCKATDFTWIIEKFKMWFCIRTSIQWINYFHLWNQAEPLGNYLVLQCYRTFQQCKPLLLY